MNREALRARLAKATRSLSLPPLETASNEVELADLLPPGPLWPAAVLIPVRWRAEGSTVVLTRRTADLTHHAGQISFPGGRIEEHDADPVAAAIRETHEEIGIAPTAVEALGYLDPYATITGFRVTPVLAFIDPAVISRHDPREVAEVFEVPLAFLLDPANCEERRREFRGRMRRFLVYTWLDYEIWGATAAMISNLAERVRQTDPAA